MPPGAPYENRHRRAPPCTPEHSRRACVNFQVSVMHCAHFSFDLLGPHKGFLDLTECAHVHEFRKNLLTEFTVHLKITDVTPEWPRSRVPDHRCSAYCNQDL